jgi:Ca2+-dependent lipid-binding protein
VLDSEQAYEEVDVVLSDEECPAVLHIKVCQARDLIAADSNGTSDPYARIHIGDDVKGGVKTRHLPKTLNPVWNESFTLFVSQEMRKQSITVEVFDKDLIGKDDSLGKFTIPLPSLPVKHHPSGSLAHLEWHPFDPVPKVYILLPI